MVMKNPKLTQETEVFRAFRLTKSGIEKLTDGELMGTYNRVVVELSARDKSTVIIEHLRRQADLLETSPERQAAPRKKKHPWRMYQCGKPRDNTWDQGEPKTKGRAKVMAADKTIRQGVAVEDTPFGGEDDTTPGKCRDRKYEDEKIADAIAEATEWEAEKDAEHEREDARIENQLWSLVLDDQKNADGKQMNDEGAVT
jgi:hypothetical protein